MYNFAVTTERFDGKQGDVLGYILNPAEVGYSLEKEEESLIFKLRVPEEFKKKIDISHLHSYISRKKNESKLFLHVSFEDKVCISHKQIILAEIGYERQDDDKVINILQFVLVD